MDHPADRCTDWASPSMPCTCASPIPTTGRTDRILRWWSGLLLRAPKATWEVSNPNGATIESRGRALHHHVQPPQPLRYPAYLHLPGSIRMLTEEGAQGPPSRGRARGPPSSSPSTVSTTSRPWKDLETAKEKTKSGIVLWIAPEGTRPAPASWASSRREGSWWPSRPGAHHPCGHQRLGQDPQSRHLGPIHGPARAPRHRGPHRRLELHSRGEGQAHGSSEEGHRKPSRIRIPESQVRTGVVPAGKGLFPAVGRVILPWRPTSSKRALEAGEVLGLEHLGAGS